MTNMPFPLREAQLDTGLLHDYPPETCLNLGFIPISRIDIYLTCASFEPWTEAKIAAIRALHYDSIRTLSIDEQTYSRLSDLLRKAEKPDNASGITTLNTGLRGQPNGRARLKELLLEACNMGASDIHIEPQESRIIVKYRINGELCVRESIHKSDKKGFVAAIKEFASLPASETKNLADCRFSHKVNGKTIDFRVAKLPVSGEYENFVMRILDSEKASKMCLPFDGNALKTFNECLNAESGMIILTGPTGSGKTTTLYSALASLDLTALNVRTIEDPIEYRLPKIVQTQIDASNGVTFANTLRSMLRADPDVIMVGEIRDAETAELAVAASNTGHLVLTTLHTKSAAGSLSRLMDLGLTRYEIQEALTLVVSQRLLPKLCPHCKAARLPAQHETERFIQAVLPAPQYVYDKKGCPECSGTGIVSRHPIFEFFRFTPEIRELVASDAPLDRIAEENAKAYEPLQISAMRAVADGICPAEVIYNFSPNARF